MQSYYILSLLQKIINRKSLSDVSYQLLVVSCQFSVVRGSENSEDSEIRAIPKPLTLNPKPSTLNP